MSQQLFDITGNDITLLNDDQLRELIGLLCEADCRTKKISVSGVTWSVHQDAKDGGIDVLVNTAPDLVGGFIPRAITGFQVKKPDMPPSSIRDEMRPKGIVRDSIKSLINGKGSYIIASSTASTADKALKIRLKAMFDAIKDEVGYEDILLDFYDRGRIATWVRCHPSLILWVRHKIGRNLKGWQPHENWTHPGQEPGEYFIDDKVRLYNGTVEFQDREISIIEGLDKIRRILSLPGSCIRLAGLSGVGKTRFVQAIFDHRTNDSLSNIFQVLYTDVSNGPDPDPRTLAQQLIAHSTNAVLVVDNCPPELHRKLAEICSGNKSTVSLITVEYDVRDDLPEETHVFRLEPASDDLIQKLIKSRFKHISEVDIETVASFAGGNARIALAIANTVRRGETLSGFQDEELFERLFHQRNSPDTDLIKSAQALSLVYSFDGTNVEINSELEILGSIIGRNPTALYADVAQLQGRDLIQSRSIWRAVLPQAIANRLARKALDNIPPKIIYTTFLNCGSERLLKSFTRRLNFLHDCKGAIQIISEWLKEDGWLGDLSNLNSLGISVLKNIAPVDPEKALEAIERAATMSSFTSRSNPHYYEFVSLLRSIAFDENLFTRSVRIICLFALTEKRDENVNSIKAVLKSLYPLYLSGTHASVKVRYSIIEELISSENDEQQELGFLLLDSALEALQFQSGYDFKFGARPRDYGYAPKTYNDIKEWYNFFIIKTVELILSGNAISIKAKKILATNFRALWTQEILQDELELAVRKIADVTEWLEGWSELKSILYFEKEELTEEILIKTQTLCEWLKPNNLSEEVKAYALSDTTLLFDYLDEEEDRKEKSSLGLSRAEEITIKLGIRLAQSETEMDTLITDLVSVNGPRLWHLGRGLAEGTLDKKTLWNRLLSQLKDTEDEKRNVDILIGFAYQMAQEQPLFYAQILDQVLTDQVARKWFVYFQTSTVIDDAAIQRIHQALESNQVPIQSFKRIGYGRSHESISDNIFADLVLKINSKIDGNEVCLELLKMRCYQKGANQHNAVIRAASRVVLEDMRYPMKGRRSQYDKTLSTIVEMCLVDEQGSTSAVKICNNFILGLAENQASVSEFNNFLGSIATVQPQAFLDCIIESDTIKDYQRHYFFRDDFGHRTNPIYRIPDQTIVDWCEIRPQSRYKLITSMIQGFTSNTQSGKLEWMSIVEMLFRHSHDIESILVELEDNVRPRSWSGSLSEILQARLVLFESLLNHKNSKVAFWANISYQRLKKTISNQIVEEESRNRTEHLKVESFE